MNAESLYNVCEFEHALKIFTQGRKLAPDSEKLKAGILKCRKTILNQVEDTNIFVFPGSMHFVDYLQKGGKDAVNDFINSKNTGKLWKTDLNMSSMGKTTEVTGSLTKEPKKLVTPDRMKKDKDYLRRLETSLAPMPGMEEDLIRKEVVQTIHETVHYLDSREEFWKQLG